MRKGWLGFVVVLMGVMFALGVVSLPASAVPPPHVITMIFPDKNMVAAIAQKLNKQPKDMVTAQELETITALEVVNWFYGKEKSGINTIEIDEKSVKTLEGIQYCKNLSYLNLACNSIDNVSYLKELKNLTWLDLSHNKKITNVIPLSNLINLTHLDIRDNNIGNIGPLSNLINLVSLEAGVNPLTGTGNLSKLSKLNFLDLSSGKSIWTISGLAGLSNLKTLWLGGNKITSISPLAGLANLEELDIGGNKIFSIAPLAGLKNLKILRAEYNQINNIGILQELTNLQIVDLSFQNDNIIKTIGASPQIIGNPTLKDITPLIKNVGFYGEESNPGYLGGDKKWAYLMGNPLIPKEQIDALKAKWVWIQDN